MGQRFQLETSITGVQHSVDVDEDGFTYIEHTPTFVEKEILDECHQLRSLRQTKGRHFQLAAKVPINTHCQWKKEWREKHSDTWTWQTFLAMKLNSRENEYMRTGYTRSGKGMKL